MTPLPSEGQASVICGIIKAELLEVESRVVVTRDWGWGIVIKGYKLALLRVISFGV